MELTPRSKLEENKLRTREERVGAWCVRGQARRRKGGGSVEARKARGTSKNDRNERERRTGPGRVEAYIGDDRNRRGFPNNAASERSDRVSRGELVQEARHIEARERRENTRRIRRRIKRLRVRSFELFNSILIRFQHFHFVPMRSFNFCIRFEF